MAGCAYCSEDLGSATADTANGSFAVCGRCFNLNRVIWDNGTASAETIEGVRTLEEMAPDGSVMRDVLASLATAIERLPVLPEIPRRVVVLAHDPVTSMAELAQSINEDAGLSMRILRRANSAANAPVDKIKDVTQACTQIGLKNIIQLAQAEMNASLYRNSPERIRALTQQLWRHNVVTACLADRIALAAHIADSDSAFLAGLVHDVGKLILLDAILNVHRGRVGRLEEDTPLLSNVLAQFGPWVGAYVVQQWKMPSELVVATFFSTNPELVPDGTGKELPLVVNLASELAGRSGFDLFEQPDAGIAEAGEPAAAAALGLPPDRCAAIANEVSAMAEELVDISMAS